MKNKFKMIGIIFMVMVIGLFAACGDNGNGGRDDPLSSITITGLGDYNSCEIAIGLFSNVSQLGNDTPVAFGYCEIDSSSEKFTLYDDEYHEFTKAGSYYVWLNIYKEVGDEVYDPDDYFMYTNGETLQDLEIEGLQDASKLPKCSLSGDASIALSKFADVTAFMEM